MNILITGSKGFIAKNLIISLKSQNFNIFEHHKKSSIKTLNSKINKSDLIIHLAASNRPKKQSEFNEVNFKFTKLLCKFVEDSNKSIPIIFTSSIHADKDTPYGKSKLKAELLIEDLSKKINNTVFIYRLPNIFGKWSNPNYNSVVATFCNNLIKGLPVYIDDKSKIMYLAYIDDVIISFNSIIKNIYKYSGINKPQIKKIYKVSLGNLFNIINSFSNRESLKAPKSGKGLIRALYATYMSYLDPKQFKYAINDFKDNRGSFIEFLKTSNSGQISFFTANPGVTRGGHYHNTKSEKFIVIQGEAKFALQHTISKKKIIIKSSSKNPEIIDIVPGWIHEITNISNQTMIVMVWANEIFDKKNPDTLIEKIRND